MKSPWWMKGVPFSCQPNCGKCCDEPGGIVYLTTSDARRISNHLGMEVQDWLAKDCRKTLDGRFILESRKSDDVCIYLNDSKQCDIYQVRPQQCAAFPWWSENLSTNRSWNEVKKNCPGLTSEDAILVEGDKIRIQIFSDRQATKGFRKWPEKY